MRACHVAYSYYPFDPRVRREVETLRRDGHRLHVITMRAPGEAKEEEVSGVRVHRIPLPIVRGGRARYAFQYGAFFLLASVVLLRHHFRERFEVVHVHSLPDFLILGAVAEKVAGAHLVLDLHEAMVEIAEARLDLNAHSPIIRLARALEWISCAVADDILVVNEVIRDRIQHRGVDPSKITVVMNSPDTRDATGPGKSMLAERLGVRGGRAIVYVGGINAERDLTLLVQATARLRQAHPLRLFIFGYGDDSYRKVLQDVAQREGLGDDLVLGGWVPHAEVISYLALSAVGPITYVSNPLTEIAVPNKVFEYAAAGRPLVIADLSAMRALFGDAAEYYRPGDLGDFVAKVDRLLSDPELGDRLAARAFKVLERCDWRIMAERLERAYRSAGVSSEGS